MEKDKVTRQQNYPNYVCKIKYIQLEIYINLKFPVSRKINI